MDTPQAQPFPFDTTPKQPQLLGKFDTPTRECFRKLLPATPSSQISTVEDPRCIAPETQSVNKQRLFNNLVLAIGRENLVELFNQGDAGLLDDLAHNCVVTMLNETGYIAVDPEYKRTTEAGEALQYYAGLKRELMLVFMTEIARSQKAALQGTPLASPETTADTAEAIEGQRDETSEAADSASAVG